ncbi:hypothetical protein QQF64_013648 [Cirrhinus molitorella]|uniref:Uncharacterized protein n=1 Tax=Cirrhinus molitorella TaxID=172907 RepID=A0ABR3LRS2_9TELE
MFTQSLSLCKDDTDRDLNGKASPAHFTLSNVADKQKRAAENFDGTSTRSVRGSGGSGSPLEWRRSVSSFVCVRPAARETS